MRTNDESYCYSSKKQKTNLSFELDQMINGIQTLQNNISKIVCNMIDAQLYKWFLKHKDVDSKYLSDDMTWRFVYAGYHAVNTCVQT